MNIRPGFIGLGIMGEWMARHVLAKFGSLLVYDIDPAKVQVLERAGAQGVSSVGELGEACSVVLLSLPGSASVREVIVGGNGLINYMSPGSVIIDTSTTEPTVSAELAQQLSAKGIDFLDAPVSGGPKGAKDATLSIMVGGKEDVFNACRAVLKAFGTTIVRMGNVGAGETAKMVNQMIVGAEFAIIAEAFALGVKSGLDPKTLYEAICNGWAGSRVLDVAAQAMLERNFNPGGTVNIHWKDLGYALSLAESLDVPTPITSLVREVFKAARSFGDGALSQPAVVRLWERLLGIEVTPQQ